MNTDKKAEKSDDKMKIPEEIIRLIDGRQKLQERLLITHRSNVIKLRVYLNGIWNIEHRLTIFEFRSIILSAIKNLKSLFVNRYSLFIFSI